MLAIQSMGAAMFQPGSSGSGGAKSGGSSGSPSGSGGGKSGGSSGSSSGSSSTMVSMRFLPGAEAIPACGKEPGPKTGVRWVCSHGVWKARKIAPYAWGKPSTFNPIPHCYDVALSRPVADAKCAGLPRPQQEQQQQQQQQQDQTPPVGTDVVVDTAETSMDQYRSLPDVYAASSVQPGEPPPIYKRPWFWILIAAVGGGGAYLALRHHA